MKSKIKMNRENTIESTVNDLDTKSLGKRENLVLR